MDFHINQKVIHIYKNNNKMEECTGLITKIKKDYIYIYIPELDYNIMACHETVFDYDEYKSKKVILPF